MGKSTINGSCSIAMLNYQRVVVPLQPNWDPTVLRCDRASSRLAELRRALAEALELLALLRAGAAQCLATCERKEPPSGSTIGNSLTNKNVGMTVEMKIARDIQIWWTMVIFPFSHAISFVFVFLHPAFSQPFGGDPKSPSPASSSGAFSAAWCSISSYGDWLIEVASGCKGVWWSL